MKKKAIIGLFAGIISGFFGSGGGMILIPAYLYILKLEDKKARATSIISIMPMVIVSSIFYINANYIDISLSIKCIMGGIIGGIIGTKLLDKISIKTLRIIFIFFLIYSATRMLV